MRKRGEEEKEEALLGRTDGDGGRGGREGKGINFENQREEITREEE